jgi:calcyphosin
LICVCRTFRIYDDNGSRTLDYEELAKGVKDYGLNMSKNEIDELFKCFDKDNSGSLSFDEFLHALRVTLLMMLFEVHIDIAI